MIDLTDEMLEERRRFGARLRALRKARGLTSTQVEAQTGISAKCLCTCELGGREVTWGTYCRLHSFFGGAGFPEYRPIAAGIKEIPVTDTVIDELDELTKTRTITEIQHGCGFSTWTNFYNVMRGKVRCVRRRTLQNIFDYLNWGNIDDGKMGEYPIA